MKSHWRDELFQKCFNFYYDVALGKKIALRLKLLRCFHQKQILNAHIVPFFTSLNNLEYPINFEKILHEQFQFTYDTIAHLNAFYVEEVLYNESLLAVNYAKDEMIYDLFISNLTTNFDTVLAPLPNYSYAQIEELAQLDVAKQKNYLTQNQYNFCKIL